MKIRGGQLQPVESATSVAVCENLRLLSQQWLHGMRALVGLWPMILNTFLFLSFPTSYDCIHFAPIFVRVRLDFHGTKEVCTGVHLVSSSEANRKFGLPSLFLVACQQERKLGRTDWLYHRDRSCQLLVHARTATNRKIVALSKEVCFIVFYFYNQIGDHLVRDHSYSS